MGAVYTWGAMIHFRRLMSGWSFHSIWVVHRAISIAACVCIIPIIHLNIQSFHIAFTNIFLAQPVTTKILCLSLVCLTRCPLGCKYFSSGSHSQTREVWPACWCWGRQHKRGPRYRLPCPTTWCGEKRMSRLFSWLGACCPCFVIIGNTDNTGIVNCHLCMSCQLWVTPGKW